MTDRQIIMRLQIALQQALTGGNHIASNLIGLIHNPALFADHEAALSTFTEHPPKVENESLNAYEQWCCWKAIMNARGIAREALKEYEDTVLPCFQD